MWNNMSKDVLNAKKVKPSDYLMPPLHHFDTPTEEGPFQYISMDFMTDLPKSKGYDTILTIVDQLCSKVTKFIKKSLEKE